MVDPEAVKALTLGASTLLFVKKLLGPSVDQVALTLANEFALLKERRQLRLNNILERAREKIEAEGKEPQPVPEKLLIPILESGSLENEPDMAERWTNLLVSAATSTVHASFPKILGELDRWEARALERLDDHRREQVKKHRSYHGTSLYDLDPHHRGGVPVELVNLLRLGLIEWEKPKVPTVDDLRRVLDHKHHGGYKRLDEISSFGPTRHHERIFITWFGGEFLRCCGRRFDDE